MKSSISNTLCAMSALAATSNSAASSAQTILEIVVGSPDHTTLEAAVLAAPPAVAGLLSDTSASLTVFAPDDDAFANLVGAVGQDYVNDLLTPEWGQHLFCVLASHVLEGVVPSSAITGPLNPTSLYGTVLSVDNVNGAITVDGNPVVGPDIMASNGIVHSITGLPILPSCVTQSIVDIGSANDNFSTLVSLVSAAGLVDALTTTRPITLLAPTNEAFADVPAAVLEYLANNVQALTDVLLYHVLSGIQLSPASGSYATLLEGKMVTIEKYEGKTEINDNVDIITLDILASNGAIHVIDTVLIPPGFMLPDASPSESPVKSPVPAPAPHPMPTGNMGMSMSSMSSSSGMSMRSGDSKSGRKSGSRKRVLRGLHVRN